MIQKENMYDSGKFVISLDFELFWGMRDHLTLENYGKHIQAVWEVLPRMIQSFENYQVKATFATVGFLFADDKKELKTSCPNDIPKYSNQSLSPYIRHFDTIGDNEETDPYHFAPSLIKLLQKYPSQEIATHTFSHYYCLEDGQTKDNFRNDLIAAITIAETKGVAIKSLVFPRNQFNEEYLEILRDLGITSYRGNEKIWSPSGLMAKTPNPLKRAFRLLDSYINLSGHNCYNMKDIAKSVPYNIPSSRFLRPYSQKLGLIEKMRVNRILNGMTYAAKNKKVYHLWWHPHNFGGHQEENFKILNKILGHYDKLNSKYGFESATMGEISHALKEKQ
ncbi:polysaccharide deacetylase family protein [Pricia sp. S334]|uniref:Polysaccharide deacetylase family protein n=1 Tax=Pricia mediterranea TaxID=3076079 RepID=A0ABU3L948_9FLAO|nr:polysaccharide deacetylase family protein [Pricia sp. S334]MDT7830197.1 polysaccharide deacetylase family protein [Pricia sp. S334]